MASELTQQLVNHRHEYGTGSITFERSKWRVRIPIGKGKYKTIGRYACACPAELHAAFVDQPDACGCGAYTRAVQMRYAALLERGDQVGGITLRQWGEAYLYSMRFRKSYGDDVKRWASNVLATVPFADRPLENIDKPEVQGWLLTLPQTLKKRSVTKNGERETITLDETISWQTAQHALALLRRAMKAAIPTHITSNPCDGLSLPKPDVIQEPLTYLSAEDVEKLCSCELCFQDARRALLPTLDKYELDMLVQCRHCPFEKRVVFVIAAHQCPREGEIAGMNWERVDWPNNGWHIAQSWEGTTKNGKTRWQALLPRAEAFLRKWWELRGSPTKGIMFPSGDSGPKAGPKRQFVRDQPADMPSAEVVRLAALEGIALTVRDVSDYRGKDRRRLRAGKLTRYQPGYDWGWADHPEEDFYRLGWWRRLGMSIRVRFHDMRDTAATHLLSGTWGYEWSVKRVSEHLGHSKNSKVTEERYAHVTKASQRAAARRTRHGVRGNGGGSADGGPQTPAQNLPRPFSDSVSNSAKSLALPTGVEPVTLGLGSTVSASSSGHFQSPGQVLGRSWAGATEHAQALLQAVLADQDHDLRPLANAVLSDPAIGLAYQVLAGGPHALDHAIELARLIVQPPAEGADTVATQPRRPGE